MSVLTKEEKLTIIEHYDYNREQVLNILLDIQYASDDGCIDQATAELVASALGVTDTRIWELVSFYALLKGKKEARYVLQICDSTPCHFTEEYSVGEALEKILKVKQNVATADGMFMFEKTSCVGNCENAPFIKIKEKVFSHLDGEEKILALINDLKEGKYSTVL